MPKVMEIATASTEAQTEVAPFTPQSHGVRAGDRSAAARKPSGKAVPIMVPSGKRIATATAIREGVELDEKARIVAGVATPKTTNTPSNASRTDGAVTSGCAARCVDQLPSPPPSKRLNS